MVAAMVAATEVHAETRARDAHINGDWIPEVQSRFPVRFGSNSLDTVPLTLQDNMAAQLEMRGLLDSVMNIRSAFRNE